MRPLPEEHRRFLQGAWGAFGRQVMAAAPAAGRGHSDGGGDLTPVSASPFGEAPPPPSRSVCENFEAGLPGYCTCGPVTDELMRIMVETCTLRGSKCHPVGVEWGHDLDWKTSERECATCFRCEKDEGHNENCPGDNAMLAITYVRCRSQHDVSVPEVVPGSGAIPQVEEQSWGCPSDLAVRLNPALCSTSGSEISPCDSLPRETVTPPSPTSTGAQPIPRLTMASAVCGLSETQVRSALQYSWAILAGELRVVRSAVCEAMVKFRRPGWRGWNVDISDPTIPPSQGGGGGQFGGTGYGDGCFGAADYRAYVRNLVANVEQTILAPSTAAVPVNRLTSSPSRPGSAPPGRESEFKQMEIQVVDWLGPTYEDAYRPDAGRCSGDGADQTEGVAARTGRGVIQLAAFNCGPLFGAARRWSGAGARGGEELIRVHVALAAVLVHELVHLWDTSECWNESTDPMMGTVDQGCLPLYRPG